MSTTQCLIAAGGSGSRLVAGGIEVPGAKSFMMIRGKALLFWCLLCLEMAGVDEIIITVEGHEKVFIVEKIVKGRKWKFKNISVITDEGVESTAQLPYVAHRWLGQKFFYAFGHQLVHPDHFKRMDETKSEGNIIFSAFGPGVGGNRRSVSLVDGHIHIDDTVIVNGQTSFNLGSPFLFDQKYISSLPTIGFNTQSVLNHYINNKMLQIVPSELPIEINDAEEYKSTMPEYEKFIDTYLISHV